MSDLQSGTDWSPAQYLDHVGKRDVTLILDSSCLQIVTTARVQPNNLEVSLFRLGVKTAPHFRIASEPLRHP
ncbi:hypothetical protein AMELA_G00196620 [Ameiurus melas]|uniref:Uncharacterized protein n=1 Tax=Ameiurus melas TaxID=219545 RepID=A0A7J6A898_AMEME|nr:hypothetical protein AMELA_G00196620 [Ameiurus melas]